MSTTASHERLTALRCRLVAEAADESDVELPAVEAAWAAGLFAGEGWCGATTRGTYTSVSLSITMLDEGSVRRFAEAFGRRVKSWPLHYDRSRRCFRVDASGRNAEAILRVLWPHLEGTAKAEQVRAACQRVGVFGWVDGSAAEPRPARRGGNQWSGRRHTEATKAKIAASQRERWERRRRADG